MLASWLPFAIVYVITLLGSYTVNRYEFMHRPEKGVRYKALPLRYKLCCPLVVAPLLAGTVLHPICALAAGLAFLLLEVACIRWYRKAGLF